MVKGARDVALDVLRRVSTQSAFASAALRSAFDRAPDLSPQDRALATELVYGVLRHRGHVDKAIGRHGKRLKDLDPRMHDVLRLGAYQLIYLDRVPAHAAVSEAVEQAKARLGPRGGGQVNAILRKIADTAPADRIPAPPPLEKEPVRHIAEVGSLPQVIAELLVADLGRDTALAFAKASLEAGSLTLRANLLRTTRDDLARETGGQPGRSPVAVHLPARGGTLPADLLAVVEGRATPQDEGSMNVVELLDPRPGERVLDVCAAPGGKTTYIAERMSDRGVVIAHDRLPDRLARVGESAARLGLRSIELVPVLPALDDAPFDRVLVDAPCSGLGTLRRHPEIRWRFAKDQLESLAKVQASVLADAAARLRPGGTLVYSVCTVTRAESEAALATLEGFELVESFRTGPQDEGAPDGFFAAKLVKKIA
ncbi:16S rRNA (cytosine(967)-C(5))-methyltransferase RsmB [Myxococcota bacterium]|nr:16S rRNA (cytosine(967)-C(5))-methyltransferase RsmB [Myxococcota bacterium]